jgi:hypothetical protein
MSTDLGKQVIAVNQDFQGEIGRDLPDKVKQEIRQEYKRRKRGFLWSWSICLVLITISTIIALVAGVYLSQNVYNSAASPPDVRARRLGRGTIVSTVFTFIAVVSTLVAYMVTLKKVDERLHGVTKKIRTRKTTAGNPATGEGASPGQAAAGGTSVFAS